MASGAGTTCSTSSCWPWRARPPRCSAARPAPPGWRAARSCCSLPASSLAVEAAHRQVVADPVRGSRRARAGPSARRAHPDDGGHRLRLHPRLRRAVDGDVRLRRRHRRLPRAPALGAARDPAGRCGGRRGRGGRWMGRGQRHDRRVLGAVHRHGRVHHAAPAPPRRPHRRAAQDARRGRATGRRRRRHGRTAALRARPSRPARPQPLADRAEGRAGATPARARG